MTIMSRHHLPLFSLCGLLFLLFGAILFSSRTDIKYDNTGSQGLVLRQQPQPEILDAFNRSLARPFGRRDHTWQFSSDRLHAKRALSSQYTCLIEKGKQYWEQGVLPAFDGQSRFPNPFFTGGAESQIQDQLLDSGWTSNEDNARLGDHWKDAFRGIAGGIPDDNVDVVRTFLDQSQDFDNGYGEQRATSAQYHGLYIPHNAAIIMFLTISPRNKVQRRRVPAPDIPKYIPRLNQLSDLVWMAWDNLVENPEVLRYYAVERIINQVASPLMDEIFKQRRGGTIDVPWSQRLTFDLESDEGKALFASPNGIAVNWLLIHHAALLGRRMPRVSIFNPGGNNRCMIWDLVPGGGEGSFGEAEDEIPGVWSGGGG
ncbi:MAG: hypothetical protein Q9226_005970 [Calogaya cf. arnoldii]